MNKQEMRGIALRAARSELRKIGYLEPYRTSSCMALKALDSLSQSEPQLMASQWYLAATENQFGLFEREWRAWQKEVLLRKHEAKKAAENLALRSLVEKLQLAGFQVEMNFFNSANLLDGEDRFTIYLSHIKVEWENA